MSIANKNYFGVGLVGLAIIAFWLFIMPTWDRLSLLNEAIAERKNILSSREEILKKIDNLNKQYQTRLADVTKISSVIPNTKSTAEFVSAIETMTQQSGLQLIEITTGEGDQQQEIQTVLIELGLVGSYPSLTIFLDLVEKNLRLLDVSEISVGKTTTSEIQTLNFRVKINAYYLNLK